MNPSNNPPPSRWRFSKGKVLVYMVAAMVVAFIALISIAIWGNGSETQKQVCSLCGDFLKGGFGALLMLLGTSAK
jgi:hypothetical protein